MRVVQRVYLKMLDWMMRRKLQKGTIPREQGGSSTPAVSGFSLPKTRSPDLAAVA